MSGKKKVMLALSGGVDSSVCVSLLRNAGYEVLAVVMKMSDAHDGTVFAAQKVADDLNVPLTVLDLKNEFNEQVIKPFLTDYQNARTPNPCIICNPNVKFKYLLQTANEQNCEYIATGHYARIDKKDGRFFVCQAKSAARDQSYMLYRLPQEVLEKLLLPLGEFEKDEVRKIASGASISSANAPDSQENCFIPDNDYAKYILEHGGQNRIGNFIAPDGKILGKHKGIIHYTIGQRKGLGVALGEPVFVDKIDPQTADVSLVFKGGQMRNKITAKDCVFMMRESLTEPIFAEVKIRSAARPQEAKITPLENGKVLIEFTSPVSAPAPSQSAVFYVDGGVLGGGFIE